MSEREHITIQVIPFRNGTFAGSGQSINYFSGPVPQLDTILLEQAHGSLLLDAEAQLEKYRMVIGKMEAIALKQNEARDFIHGLIQEL
ncbi:Scr1 family TA system antitoxin-like transcriptional regulator [Streptomyces antimycoticus]